MSFLKEKFSKKVPPLEFRGRVMREARIDLSGSVAGVTINIEVAGLSHDALNRMIKTLDKDGMMILSLVENG